MENNSHYLEKPLPSNADAEKAIMGGIILDNALITQAIGIINADDFYSRFHKETFRAMVKLFEEGKVIDPITIAEKLKEIGSVESFGGIASITNLTYGLPHFSSITEYVAIVREKSIARTFIKQSNLAVAQMLEEEESVLSIIERHEQSVFQLKRNETKQIVKAGDVAKSEMARIVDFAQNNSTGNALLGLSTGFRALNEAMSGLVKSDVILVAGRPSMGKSSLSLNLVSNAVEDDAEAVALIFTLEMSKEQTANRINIQQSKIDSTRFRTGRLIREEWTRATDTIGRMENQNIFIDDTPSVSPLYIKSKCLELVAREKRLDLVLIDYVQLMSGAKKSESRQQEVSDISRATKAIAKELDVPIILVSQLSRAPEARADKRPILSDLRESGSLEQDCDVVIFVYRDEYYKKTEENKGVAEFIIAKNRNGATGTYKASFLADFATFEEMYQQR